MSPRSRVTPELVRETTKLVVSTQFASQSMVQRKVRVGFATSCQLLEALTECGVLGPAAGSTPREVLYGPAQLDQALARLTEQETA